MYYDESIIIGDDESLTLLGAEIQSEIRNTTKDIVNILLCNDNNIGIILNEMLNELTNFRKIVIIKNMEFGETLERKTL